MLSENRIFNYTGKLNLNRSKVLNEKAFPKDDTVNWLFLAIENNQFGFVYKIHEPIIAKYNFPFNVDISFFMFDIVKNDIMLDHEYEVFRGQEKIGSIVLTGYLE